MTSVSKWVAGARPRTLAAAIAPVLVATDNTGADDLTNAVVAIFKLTSPSAGVGAVGTPVNVGLSNGAFNACNESVVAVVDASSVATALVVNCVVANCVVFVPALAVGATGVPVNVGEIFCACTNAVVAICVVEVTELAVGAIGMPVNVGLSFSPCTNAVVAN